MYGLKRLNGGAASSLPAVDAAAAAACPASLEISGHRQAAARVIASLLVGPGMQEDKKKTRQKMT